ncbi:MAG TPA: CbtA family protein [Hansschlegelia sp.]
MHIFRNIVFVAALVGLAAGIVLTVLQQFGTEPLIVKAEVIEKANAAKAEAAPHEHAAGHDHGAGEEWEPADGAERFGWTVVANVVSGVGFALLLVAASELKGGLKSWREGLLWGLAGFAVFTLAPSVGLPPEAPGVEGAPLMDRQIWWIATAVATAIGLALIAYGRSPLTAIAAIALIVAPHIVGAPQPAEAPAIPHDLEHGFVVAVIVTGFLFWATIGTLAGVLRGRFADA